MTRSIPPDTAPDAPQGTNREAAVAGRFYPATQAALKREMGRCFADTSPRGGAVGVVAPHAGFVFSGRTAGLAYGDVQIGETVVVLSPNHTGRGPRHSVYPAGRWDIPSASFQVDTDFVEAVIRRTAQAPHPLHLVRDTLAHETEHGVETHLPFVAAQHIRAGGNPAKLPQLVAMVLAATRWAEVETLGNALAEVIRTRREEGKSVLLAASTDMTHFESAARASRLDALAIRAIEALEPQRLMQVCEEHRITMCGVVPTAVVLHAARCLGAHSAELLSYTHSGQVTGDDRRVVGYAGLSIR